MNGYMDLFLETGSPAFYMLAKQERSAAKAAAGGATGGAANRVKNSTAEEETSLR